MMSSFKKLFYVMFVLMFGNPVILTLFTLILLQNITLLTVLVIIGGFAYHYYIWMPLRCKYYTLDDECLEMMGWKPSKVNFDNVSIDVLPYMEKITTYEDCPVDQNLLVWTGDSFEVEYVEHEAEFGTYYPANGVEFTHFMLLPDDETCWKELGDE